MYSVNDVTQIDYQRAKCVCVSFLFAWMHHVRVVSAHLCDPFCFLMPGVTGDECTEMHQGALDNLHGALKIHPLPFLPCVLFVKGDVFKCNFIRAS